MSIRTVSVIVLAIVCGLCAAVGINFVLAKPGGTAAPPPETMGVLVAKIEIPRGKMVTADALELKQWPKDLVPVGVMVNPLAAKDRAALQTMLPGEPLFESKLAAKGAVGGMANLIPSGKRAYTIQTKTVASNVAGFVLPGNLVDVLLTFRGNPNDETGGGSTTTLLQSVEVMAVGGKIETIDSTLGVGSEDVSSVTLLVTPDEVGRLDLGQGLGMLSLSLRNPNDKGETHTDPATIKDIRFMGMKPAEVVAPVAPASTPTAVAVAPPVPEPAKEVVPVQPAKPKAVLVSSSIKTLRGQRWGEVTVTEVKPE
jgi:pilus assembly protein CpaB